MNYKIDCGCQLILLCNSHVISKVANFISPWLQLLESDCRGLHVPTGQMDFSPLFSILKNRKDADWPSLYRADSLLARSLQDYLIPEPFCLTARFQRGRELSVRLHTLAFCTRHQDDVNCKRMASGENRLAICSFLQKNVDKSDTGGRATGGGETDIVHPTP